MTRLDDAAVAEALRGVTLSACIHSAAGLTPRDFELARTIDATGTPA